MEESVNPKISVIVPVYNAEKYLHKCIDSILAQTITDFELLLINDGSKDNSGTICDEYAKKDNRVRVFHKENGGPGLSRNVGILSSTGMYLSFVDADDWLEKQMLEQFYLMATTYKTDIVVAGRINEYVKKNRTTKIALEDSILYHQKDFYHLWLKLKTHTLEHFVWNKLYRRDLIISNNILFALEPKAEDTFFNFDVWNVANRIYVLNDSFYHYRIEEMNSLSYKNDIDLLLFVNQKLYNSYSRFTSRFCKDKDHGESFLSQLSLDLAFGLLVTLCSNPHSSNKRKRIKIIEDHVFSSNNVRNAKTMQAHHIYKRIYKKILTHSNPKVMELFFRYLLKARLIIKK